MPSVPAKIETGQDHRGAGESARDLTTDRIFEQTQLALRHTEQFLENLAPENEAERSYLENLKQGFERELDRLRRSQTQNVGDDTLSTRKDQ